MIIKRYNPADDKNYFSKVVADGIPSEADNGVQDQDILYMVDNGKTYIYHDASWYDRSDGTVLS